MTGTWPRPVPVVGDGSSARQRVEDPRGWAMGADVARAFEAVVAGRRDIRRYRPDPLPDELLDEVLAAGHRGPSVGHSQPWRFIVVRDRAVRDRAAHLADQARLAQAEHLSDDRAGRLLDLKLEGLREAPVGIVVACDRRTSARGVLGRATFPDADLWSCACAIENMWLTARVHGLGMGWVTLFEPTDLAALLELPDGVETLGWLCLGWPDERPPDPGLERAAWSRRMPLSEVVMHDRWPAPDQAPAPPDSHLRGPSEARLVAATDAADELLAPPDALGALDRVLNRVEAVALRPVDGGTLVLAAADHPVADLEVSAYSTHVTRDVAVAAVAGSSMGAVAAGTAGLGVVVVDAGIDGPALRGAEVLRPRDARGDLAGSDALTAGDVDLLVEGGREVGRRAARSGLVVLGEVGVGNTTVAAALACALLDLSPDEAVGLGAGADSGILVRKREVVAAGLERAAGRRAAASAPSDHARICVQALGGPEVAVLTGVVLGAVEARAVVVLDGLCTSLAGLLATRFEPAVQSHLVAGQVSRERAHPAVLRGLGLEPLLSLRLRAGEGVGGCLATSLVLQALAMRRMVARTAPPTAL